MTNRLSVTQHFDVAPTRIAALMGDRDYLTARLGVETGMVAGELVRLEIDGEQTIIESRAAIPRATLPGMLAGFLSSDPIVTRAETWHTGDPVRADLLMSVDGAPVTLTGHVEVGGDQTSSTVQFEATASTQIPMFADAVETTILRAVTGVLAAEESFTRDWLAAHP